MIRNQTIARYSFIFLLISCLSLAQSEGGFAQKVNIADSIRTDALIRHIIDSPMMLPQRMVDIGNEIINFPERDNYETGMIRGYTTVASGDMELGKTIEAIDYLKKAIELSRKKKITRAEAIAEAGLGQMYDRLGIHEKSFECYTNSLELYKKLKDTLNIAVSYRYLGYSLLDLKKYSEANSFFFKALEINNSHKNLQALALNYIDIGGAYEGMKNYPEAFKYLLHGARIFTDTLKDTVTDAYSNLGMCYQMTGKYDSALYYYQKALHIATMMQNAEDLHTIMSNMGNLFFKQRKIDLAEQYLLKALSIAKEISNTSGELSSSSNLADIYAFKKDFLNAYKYELEAYGANDSLMNTAKEQAIAEMQIRFDVKNLDEKNKLLLTENNLERVKIKQKNILVFVGFGVSVLILIIGIQIIRQNRLKNAQQKMELEQKQLLAQINPHFIFNCLNSTECRQ